MDEIPEGYEYLGWYETSEAGRLLEALETSGIPVHAGIGGRGGVLISVESARRPEVDSIHGRMFGTGLANLSDAPEDLEDWCDQDGLEEIRILERRAALVRELADLDDELTSLLDELAEVDGELREAAQSPARLEALRNARDRHAVNVERLQAGKKRLTDELHGVDQEIYAPQTADSQQDSDDGR